MHNVIFDGKEPDMHIYVIKTKCPNCSSDISVPVKDMRPLGEIKIEVFTKKAFKKLGLSRRSGGNLWHNSDGIMSYGIKFRCNGCNMNIIIVAGIKEIQASRFIVTFEGIIKPE